MSISSFCRLAFLQKVLLLCVICFSLSVRIAANILAETAAIIVSIVEKGLMINSTKAWEDVILNLNELTFCALRI